MAIRVEKYVPLTSGTPPKPVILPGSAPVDGVIQTYTVITDDRVMTDELECTDYDVYRPE